VRSEAVWGPHKSRIKDQGSRAKGQGPSAKGPGFGKGWGKGWRRIGHGLGRNDGCKGKGLRRQRHTSSDNADGFYYRRGGCSTTRPACQHLLLRRSSSNPWLMHTLALGVYPPCGRPCLAHSSAEIRHAHPGHLAECLAFRLGLEEEMRWRVVRRQWHEALVKHELFKVRFGHGDVRHRLRRSPACAVRLCHAGSVDRTRGGGGARGASQGRNATGWWQVLRQGSTSGKC
jgi:hypothetical protein